jgi:hypothetical protein
MYTKGHSLILYWSVWISFKLYEYFILFLCDYDIVLCGYVWIHVCLYVYTNVRCMYVLCMYARMYVHMHVCICSTSEFIYELYMYYVYMYVYIYVRKYICMPVYTYVRM